MNREQWQQKRSQVEAAALPPPFGTGNPVLIDHATDRPSSSGQRSGASRKQQYYEALACCEWAIMAPGADELPALPIRPE